MGHCENYFEHPTTTTTTTIWSGAEQYVNVSQASRVNMLHALEAWAAVLFLCSTCLANLDYINSQLAWWWRWRQRRRQRSPSAKKDNIIFINLVRKNAVVMLIYFPLRLGNAMPERRALDAHRIMKPFRHQLLLWTRRATRCGWLCYKINHFHWFVFASEMYIPWRVWREPILLMDFSTWCALVFFNVLRYPAPINKFFVKARHFLWYFVCFFF